MTTFTKKNLEKTHLPTLMYFLDEMGRLFFHKQKLLRSKSVNNAVCVKLFNPLLNYVNFSRPYVIWYLNVSNNTRQIKHIL